MKRWLTIGSILLVVGLLKIWQHTSAPKTLEDYLAFRCGSADADAHSFLTIAGHCWGCPVAVAGAAIIIASIFMALSSHRQPAYRRAVAVRRTYMRGRHTR